MGSGSRKEGGKTWSYLEYFMDKVGQLNVGCENMSLSNWVELTFIEISFWRGNQKNFISSG